MSSRSFLDHLLQTAQSGLKQVGVVEPRGGEGNGVTLSDFGRGSLAGGALGLLLGSGRGSGLLKVGGLAALGVMAYKAYGQWQDERGSSATSAAAAAPAALTAPTEKQANALLSALVAAAKADGHVDERERGLIAQGLQQAGAAPELQRWLEAELAKPLDPLQVASAVDSPELASEVYLLSRTVIEQPTFMEQAYLDGLAQALTLEPGLRQRLDVQSAAITQSIS
ncbi:MAG: tellurite resistance TerB family protein [Xanthomonadaceae bacterium]|nr:tellurite resistance TerB family protein [Xanthomonadaceae bacterium]MDP2186734.1 tellurite resistance TerB family protein [Xanthomonadales bacterium]MDZ4117594.1 tellurite resistance TerB family protein [Xanthomonadaceae bacterium]MDZ4376715.1 tellurite resistance TerB family protein [Xanthomonadaceae bacterium]